MKRAPRTRSAPPLPGSEPEKTPPPVEDEEAGFYRCPACGESVNGKDIEAVRFHHSHVLHPNARSPSLTVTSDKFPVISSS